MITMMTPGRMFSLAVALVFGLAMGGVGLLDGARLSRGLVNLGIFAQDLFPPDLRVLPIVAYAMWETLQIAVVGTILGFAFALPLALGASHVLFGPMVTEPIRVLLSVVRTVPSIFWGIIFVVAVGLGPAAGALGIALYSLGYLGKLLYEGFDGVDPEIIEAVRSVGASRAQLAVAALLPESTNLILSQLLFMFEYNVRASSIMGLVGAGGIGFYLIGYIQMLQYANLMTALLVTLLVVVIIDQISGRLRRAFLLPTTQHGAA